MVQVVQPLRFVQSPSFILPRVAGEEPEVGLNVLNCLNILNNLEPTAAGLVLGRRTFYKALRSPHLAASRELPSHLLPA
jgi:hypothetical protein